MLSRLSVFKECKEGDIILSQYTGNTSLVFESGFMANVLHSEVGCIGVKYSFKVFT